jgi:FkbM family methyltransferase
MDKVMMITDLHNYLTGVRGAIHVGANIGEEAGWYDQHGFSKVVWFEPNLDLIPTLQENIAKFPNQICYPCGIHDTLKEGTLHISNNGGQSSSILEFGTHSINHPSVVYVKDMTIQFRRLDELFESELNIEEFNFLNIDTQGTELKVIKSLRGLVAKFDYIYAVVNDDQVYKNCALVTDIDRYLLPFGFTREITKMTKAHWGDALYKRR